VGDIKNSEKKERFDAVQSLRFLCFFVVFGVHSGFINFASQAAVLEIFIVLSGFMMMYAYRNKDLDSNPWFNFKFAVKKIGKLYPLHAVTTTIQWGMMFWLYIATYAAVATAGGAARAVFGFWPEYLLHMGLVHAWVPNQTINFLFNGPSWYLSATLFMYFMFPWILRFIKSIKNRSGLIGLGVSTLAVMYVIAYFSNTFGSEEFGIWIMAHCPIMKLGDFIIGCVFGKLYLDWKKNCSDEPQSKMKWTIIELMVIGAVVGIEFLIRIPTSSPVFDMYSFVGTVGFNVIAVALVLIFLLNRGYITKIIGNKVLIYLGDISAYTYLTHYIFTIAWTDICFVYNIDNTGWIKWVAIVVEFILTIASGAFCYHLAKRSAQKKKLKKQTA